MSKKYKYEEEYKKSYTRTIALVVNENLLLEIDKVSHDIYRGECSRSWVIRRLIRLGLDAVLIKGKT